MVKQLRLSPIVLTNSINKDKKKYKKSLIKLLQKVHPKMKYFEDIDENSKLADKSYMYQVKLAITHCMVQRG